MPVLLDKYVTLLDLQSFGWKRDCIVNKVPGIIFTGKEFRVKRRRENQEQLTTLWNKRSS